MIVYSLNASFRQVVYLVVIYSIQCSSAMMIWASVHMFFQVVKYYLYTVVMYQMWVITTAMIIMCSVYHAYQSTSSIKLSNWTYPFTWGVARYDSNWIWRIRTSPWQMLHKRVRFWQDTAFGQTCRTARTVITRSKGWSQNHTNRPWYIVELPFPCSGFLTYKNISEVRYTSWKEVQYGHSCVRY